MPGWPAQTKKAESRADCWRWHTAAFVAGRAFNGSPTPAEPGANGNRMSHFYSKGAIVQRPQPVMIENE